MSIDISKLIKFASDVNPEWAAKRIAEAYAYKEGKRFDGKDYKNMISIWRQWGKISYGAFRVRLHRGNNIKYSLGLED